MDGGTGTGKCKVSSTHVAQAARLAPPSQPATSYQLPGAGNRFPPAGAAAAASKRANCGRCICSSQAMVLLRKYSFPFLFESDHGYAVRHRWASPLPQCRILFQFCHQLCFSCLFPRGCGGKEILRSSGESYRVEGDGLEVRSWYLSRRREEGRRS